MVGGMGGETGEARDLPLHIARGGPEVRVRGRGARDVPDVHADAGEFYGMPGAYILRDVEPFSCPAGGSACS